MQIMKATIPTTVSVVETSVASKRTQRSKGLRAVRPNLTTSRHRSRATAPAEVAAPRAARTSAKPTAAETILTKPETNDMVIQPHSATSTQFSDAVVFLPMAEAGALFPEPTPHELQAEMVTVEAVRAEVVKPAAVVEDTSIIGRGRYDEHTSLRLYLRDAVATDLLTPAQEIELAHRIQAGDDAAREHMIRANLRLVVKIAREYEDFGLPLLDLINEGNMGLMRAVERFDPTKGAKLSTYAAWWIKQSIRRALSNQSKSIRLPIHIVQELARMKKAESRLESELGRPPTAVELAAELEADVDDIERWRAAAAIGATSLDAPLGNEPDSSRVADVIADENAVMPWSGVSEETNAELVRELVNTLNPREQTILRRRFALDGGDAETLEMIGESFGLTRERIRQLEAAALKKLRDRLKAREVRMAA